MHHLDGGCEFFFALRVRTGSQCEFFFASVGVLLGKSTGTHFALEKQDCRAVQVVIGSKILTHFDMEGALQMNRMLLGYNPDFDAFDMAPPVGRPSGRQSPPVFNNVDTMSLAIDLLEVNTKPQLDAAVRRIVRRAGETVGRPLNQPVAAALSDLLEVAARHALPKQFVAPIATNTDAKTKGRFFGIELEGLSPEDQEFETAKAFVRFASEATRRAASVSERLLPRTAAHLASLQSARRYAPGWPRLVRRAALSSTTGPNGSTTGAISASTF